jgi:hypothetical protein
MYGQSVYWYTVMHGQSLYWYTVMHGQSLYWYTVMHSQSLYRYKISYILNLVIWTRYCYILSHYNTQQMPYTKYHNNITLQYTTDTPYTKWHKFWQWCPGISGPAKLLNTFQTIGSLIRKKWHQTQRVVIWRNITRYRSTARSMPMDIFQMYVTENYSHLDTEPHNCFIWNRANLLLCKQPRRQTVLQRYSFVTGSVLQCTEQQSIVW